ncbi:hypothetical protein AGOR_G00117070 [Albula goreensis]|uniref:Uncharacterized protein n=1 Tax=Albula goreensis TaxID=1534307 RepID=A0A8T3DBB2_9TELE|nr:hypothetical protein AGOR_G00117070 [Albula goreensis]
MPTSGWRQRRHRAVGASYHHSPPKFRSFSSPSLSVTGLGVTPGTLGAALSQISTLETTLKEGSGTCSTVGRSPRIRATVHQAPAQYLGP